MQMSFPNGRFHRIRGQALTETALVLPLFLLLLFGVIWSSQAGTIAERAQIAVRFNGLVANEASPYNLYSLSALYNAAPNVAPPVNTCAAVSSDPFTDQNQFAFQGMPGGTPAYFLPSSIGAGSCQRAVAILSGGNLSGPVVFIQTQTTASATLNTQSVLTSALGPSTIITAEQNFFVTPDIPRLMSCYNELGTAVSQTLNNTPMNASAAPAAISETPDSSALNVNTGCAN
ncbi:MAG: pilus assembly protein [Candidatus Eremiobacteraeota bacterium]|nr:pilus assembly protein [Candidatus Eremiobacteraeota bacterium]